MVTAAAPTSVTLRPAMARVFTQTSSYAYEYVPPQPVRLLGHVASQQSPPS